AGLGAGAGQPKAAEWLHADDRADHVAVDIDVADLNGVDDVVNSIVNPGVNAEREPVARAFDRLQHLGQPVGTVAHHVQHRTEYFFLELPGIGEFENMWRGEISFRRRASKVRARFLLHPRDMSIQLLLRLGIDHWADMRRW